jgi:hypothetical protein
MRQDCGARSVRATGWLEIKGTASVGDAEERRS